MVQLEEVEDDELDQAQPGPLSIGEDDDDFTDTGSSSSPIQLPILPVRPIPLALRDLTPRGRLLHLRRRPPRAHVLGRIPDGAPPRSARHAAAVDASAHRLHHRGRDGLREDGAAVRREDAVGGKHECAVVGRAVCVCVRRRAAGGGDGKGAAHEGDGE